MFKPKPHILQIACPQKIADPVNDVDISDC